MPTRDLPAHVKSIVTEIETEIGEEGADDAAPALSIALDPAAAIEGALANVEINLESMKDQTFVAEIRKRTSVFEG